MPVSSGEDAVVQRQSRQGHSSSASAAAPAATSSSSCELYQKIGVSGGGAISRISERASHVPRGPRAARGSGGQLPTARRSSRLHEEARGVLSEQLGNRRAGPGRGGNSTTRGLTAETIETFRYGLRAGGRPRHAARAVRQIGKCRRRSAASRAAWWSSEMAGGSGTDSGIV